MMYYPNAKNSILHLLKIVNVIDKIGITKPKIINQKEVYGIIKSITSKEYLTNIQISKNVEFKVLVQCVSFDESKFVLLNNEIYKIERTYINGNFVELFLSTTDYKLEELL